ncbi:TMEM175 family protein [Sebaldella sp. S0638]|uniref:TMEM175 family protein n=1 Tax=Sebaldella sp. S0638 TaxID=2957809 RepID=UPI00209D2C96|nr:TMEM175 family protein [Sebaldella sp. S0638]MCP1226406.1 TMEM175 family protein [Sebaldella sp. S0638]
MDRLKALSDGIISIVLTIMLLNVELPTSYLVHDLKIFLISFFIYLTSFTVIMVFWKEHYFLFKEMKVLTNDLIWYNGLFLFFLSCIPIFTKWVIKVPFDKYPELLYGTSILISTIILKLLVIKVYKISKNQELIFYEKKINFLIIRYCFIIIIGFFIPFSVFLLILIFPVLVYLFKKVKL